MKTSYIAPVVEIAHAEASQMMALSLQQGAADPAKPILVQEESDMDIWSTEMPEF